MELAGVDGQRLDPDIGRRGEATAERSPAHRVIGERLQAATPSDIDRCVRRGHAHVRHGRAWSRRSRNATGSGGCGDFVTTPSYRGAVDEAAVIRVRPAGPRRQRFAIGAAVVLAMVLPACDGDDDAATTTTSTIVPPTTTTIPPRENDGVLKVGVFLPRTGPGASLGEPMISALQDASTDINTAGGVLGHNVELLAVDENSSTGIDELLVAGVDAIVGPASSTVALSQLGDALNPVNGVVTCSPSATSLALDDYPDPNKLFFRTVPSDSMQMAAIARRAQRTGHDSVAVGYLDDPYGRGLQRAFVDRVTLDVQTTRGFGADDDQLGDVAEELLAGDPGVVVVLGDADDGTRLLAALDEAADGTDIPQVFVNDAIRGGRQAIQALSPAFRERLSGVGPMATSLDADGPTGYFAANAVDCLTLIALAATQAGSDDPAEIQKNMAAVSAGGQPCMTYAGCVDRLERGLTIDYNGSTGEVDLSTTTGEVVRGMFEAFEFDDQGVDHPIEDVPPFEIGAA